MSTIAHHLCSVDTRWRQIVDRVGPFVLPESGRSDFEALARSIVYQQLAGAAAASIEARLRRAFGGRLVPAKIATAEMAALRAAGLSESKARSILELACAVDSGTLDLARLRGVPDEEVERALCAIRGIGPWTTHMYLIFHLRRPDVWPIGDYAVRRGFQTIFELPAPPSSGDLLPLGDPYRPYRTAVAWYCWRTLDVRTPGA